MISACMASAELLKCRALLESLCAHFAGLALRGQNISGDGGEGRGELNVRDARGVAIWIPSKLCLIAWIARSIGWHM